MSNKLTRKQYILLREALHIYVHFHSGKPLTQVSTGLGSYTKYKTCLDAGLMTYFHSPEPGYATWWKLTERGAAIVQNWIDV